MKSVFLLCACCALLVPLYAEAPPSAALVGRVVDPSNAVVPSAALELSNTATGEIITIRADSQGTYTFSPLKSGAYNITAEAPGFAKFAHQGLVLVPGATVTFDVVLQIPAMAEQVTVTAKAPSFQEALEVRDIRESSARDVGEALAKVDGLWKIRKGGIGNDIVLRGFQSSNLNVLIDGARIFGACPNRMDPPAFHVDFSEIQDVAVTKGAFDVKNEGSLGGVVQILSKPPLRGFHVVPNISVGSFGFVNPSVTGSLWKGTAYGLLGYSFRTSQPYIDGAGNPFTAYANYRNTARDQNAFDVQTGWGRFGFAPRENQRLELGYTHQAGGRILYPYLMMDAGYDNADRLNASYDISHLTSAFKHLRFQGYFTQVEHWMTDELRTSSVGATRPYSMATLADTKAAGGKIEGEISDVVLGVEVFRRNWNATNAMRMAGGYMDQSFIPDVATWVAGAYADYRRVFLGKLRFQAGGRLDAGWSEAQSPMVNTDLYWAYKSTRVTSNTNTNPAGNVQLAYSVGKGVEIFAGLGRTVRLPDPEERYVALMKKGTDWVGNPNLLPTQNTEVDLGINYTHGRFQLRPTAFYSHLSNFITVHNQPRVNDVMGVMNMSARSYENVDAELYGGELSYSVGITRSLVFLGGTSYSVGTKRPRPEYKIVSPHLVEVPPLKTRAVLRYGTSWFFAEIEGTAVDQQNRVDTDLNELRTPGYTTFGFRIGVHTNKLNLTAGIDNALNRFYYEHFSYQRDPFRSGAKVPEPGRNLSLAVSYDF